MVKLEYLAPTGSFKDRGTAVMMNELIRQGVSRVVEDSSGNAGASVAAYSARAGIGAHVFVPAYASPGKRAQIAVYGAQVEAVPGSREEAKRAAIQAADADGVAYASHAYHPGFLLGQETVAWELWEQLDRKAPDWYLVPVGQGVHLLGVWRGFRRLQRAGLVDRIPRLVGVQAALLAPVCEAFEAGLLEVPGLEFTVPTQAEGLAIPKPVRGQRVLEAIRNSGGGCVAVTEEQIALARRRAALQGLYIEPTSATALAAVEAVAAMAGPKDTVVVPLTGSGLKGSPTVD
jgi:threonine synthase